MIHQLKLTLLGEPGIKGQLGISRPPLHQTPARVIADTTNDRGTDTGRTDHRVGVLAEWRQHLLESIQRATSVYQGLLRIAQGQAGIEFEGADNHDLTIVVVPIRGRTASNSCIGSLADNNAVSRHGGLEYLPKRQ